MATIQLADKTDIQNIDTRVTALEQSGGGGDFMLPHFTSIALPAQSTQTYSRTGKGILRFFYTFFSTTTGNGGYIIVDPDGKGTTTPSDYRIPLTVSKAQNSSQNYAPILGSAVSWIGLPNSTTTIENAWAGVVFEIPYENSINLTMYGGTGGTNARFYINDLYAE